MNKDIIAAAWIIAFSEQMKLMSTGQLRTAMLEHGATDVHGIIASLTDRTIKALEKKQDG